MAKKCIVLLFKCEIDRVCRYTYTLYRFRKKCKINVIQYNHL